MAEFIHAPFTPEQVAALNIFQQSTQFHPYTCLFHSNTSLIATIDGWSCPHCDYRQTWAHSFTAAV